MVDGFSIDLPPSSNMNIFKKRMKISSGESLFQGLDHNDSWLVLAIKRVRIGWELNSKRTIISEIIF